MGPIPWQKTGYALLLIFNVLISFFLNSDFFYLGYLGILHKIFTAKHLCIIYLYRLDDRLHFFKTNGIIAIISKTYIVNGHNEHIILHILLYLYRSETSLSDKLKFML